MAGGARDGRGILNRVPEQAPLGLALALFFLSGAGALVIQTGWMRWLRDLLGATAPAASATLVAFFMGQGIGAAAAGRFAARARRPLAAYGALELGAAAWAAAVPLLLQLGDAALTTVYDRARQLPLLLVALRFAIALCASLPASIAFGATLPTLALAVIAHPIDLGRRGAALYGVNTLGAALGTALASFWLPDLLGVRLAYACGVACLLAAGGAAIGAASLGSARRAPAELLGLPAPTSTPSAEAVSASSPVDGSPPAPGATSNLVVATLSGFGSFAAEVLFVQSFSLVMDNSIYAFGAVLVAVLSTLAVGAIAVSVAVRLRRFEPTALLRVGMVGAALALAAFPPLFVAATRGLQFFGSGLPTSRYLIACLGLAFLTAGPALLAAGLVYPGSIAAEGARGGAAAVSERLGRLGVANTTGALAGALAAPYLLLPTLGLWPAFLFLAASYGGAALALPGPSRRGAAAALALGASALIAANPLCLPPMYLREGERVLDASWTPAGLVSVVARGQQLMIKADNLYLLGSSQIGSQEREAHVALLLRPDARRVAWVGSATGVSAGATLAHPIERLSLVELVPGVAGAAERFFAPWNRRVYDDPRTESVLDDGRNFLRLSREQFDVVVADLFVPWQAGAASLYTREHFAAVRERLTENGVFCQWLPLYQLNEPQFLIIAATFLDVYPRAALFRGDFFGGNPIAALVGYAGAPPSADDVSRAAAQLGQLGIGDRWVNGPIAFWSLYVGPLDPSAPEIAGAPLNTDDRPRIQFMAPRSRVGVNQGRVSFTGIRWTRFANRVAERLREEDPIYGALGEARLRAARGGAALQASAALFAAGRRAESDAIFFEASALLPPKLLDSPDPTALSFLPTTVRHRHPLDLR